MRDRAAVPRLLRRTINGVTFTRDASGFYWLWDGWELQVIHGEGCQMVVARHTDGRTEEYGTLTEFAEAHHA